MKNESLSEQELDQLEILLDELGGEAMRLDEIQAMLCAIVSGPDMIPPSTWLPEALGGEPDNLGSAEIGVLLELLMRLNNDVARALLNNETVATIVYPLDEEGTTYDYASWADAYLFGAGLGRDWFDAAGKHNDDLSELLEPFFMLNGMLKEDVEKQGERWYTPAEEARVLTDIQENLPAIVQSLYNFWRNKRGESTVRREGEKTGRNDPCPCGSGKKFKQCCGAGSDTLH